ncbi:Crp/Fnr family transcriptional regulator [Marinilongibacter aquaticus]|uniref:Crp/Fnr family transcriptional regulator n=1 Tax=Marinilongibacter aquaticus TaxID=2975157 RepID=UPI0021BD63FC|nr:Crp/Fnr family transcriptional regulator [Marinilongibacter aquaticus]UBM59522.1 Crp/Fnr family transcriptional regulator [Marinilongibacter aquaticus]
MEALFCYIQQFHELSDRDKAILTQHCQTVHLQKGEYFIQSGKACRKIGFVIQGILRNYCFDNDGKEITKYFLTPLDFATDFQSFNGDGVSQSFIQAETEAKLLVLEKKHMPVLSAKIDHWDTTSNHIISTKLLAKVNLKTEMLNLNATEKYLSFVENQPEIVQNVPLGHIASYLGMTPFSLSRIRKNILQNDFLPNGKS